MVLRLITLGGLLRPLNSVKITKFSNGKNLSTHKSDFMSNQTEGKKSWFNKIPGEKGLFSIGILKKHYEILPLLIIVGGGITILMTGVLRIAMTRDDVRYASSGKLPYEKTDLENFKKRKFLIFNQNYDTVDELKNIYKDIYADENTSNENKSTEKK